MADNTQKSLLASRMRGEDKPSQPYSEEIPASAANTLKQKMAARREMSSGTHASSELPTYSDTSESKEPPRKLKQARVQVNNKAQAKQRLSRIAKVHSDEPEQPESAQSEATQQKQETKPAFQRAHKKNPSIDSIPDTAWGPKVQAHPEANAMPDAAAYDQALNNESLQDVAKKAKREKAGAIVRRVVTVILLILCGYVSFLIYGVSQTNYVYDQYGKIQPEVLSVDDLSILNEYETLSQYYLRERVLYEAALKLDYRLAVEPENALTIGMEYNGLLDTVSKLTTDINAESVSTTYSAIKNQLLNWVKTDIAVYLQNMSKAITNNSETDAQHALISRDVVYNDFLTITSNMATLCHNTKGAHNGNIYDWSPEDYVNSLEEG